MTSTTWTKFWGATYARTPHNNGVGRFVQQLQRVTFKFCKSSGSSKGVRDFIEQDVIHYARANPGVVVYLKPRRHRAPALKAEYLNGEADYLSLHNRSRDDIVRWVDHYSGRSGQPSMRIMKHFRTDLPSIQGSWTPWTHKHPHTFISTFPNEEASAAEKMERTATDELRDIAERAFRASQ